MNIRNLFKSGFDKAVEEERYELAHPLETIEKDAEKAYEEGRNIHVIHDGLFIGEIIKYEFPEIKDKFTLPRDCFVGLEYINSKEAKEKLELKYKPYHKFNASQVVDMVLEYYTNTLMSDFFERHYKIFYFNSDQYLNLRRIMKDYGFSQIKGNNYGFELTKWNPLNTNEEEQYRVVENGRIVNPWCTYFSNVKDISDEEGLITYSAFATLFDLWADNQRIDTEIILCRDKNKILCDKDFYKINFSDKDYVEKIIKENT